jgi:hypothetical protein
VVVKAAWQDQVDWKGLDIGPFSFWRIYVKKLLAFHSEEGIFSLPRTHDRHYAEVMEERERLSSAGISF